jgi:hypothetical protein
MTEAEWLSVPDAWSMVYALVASLDPSQDFRRGARTVTRAREPSAHKLARKLRLFAVGCVRRQAWCWRTEPIQSRAIEVAERFADGEATLRELRAANGPAVDQEDKKGWTCLGCYASDRDIVTSLHFMIGNAAAAAGKLAVRSASSRAEMTKEARKAVRENARNIELSQQALLLRCVIRNPLGGHPTISAESLTSVNRVAYDIAKSIYTSRAFDRLPILADALEEAGCADADILAHCRGPGPHVRGCWVVDLLLGKE